MHMRKNQSDFQTNRVINKATKELTKTALIVTVMFIVCLGFDLWYYVLAYNGVIAYIFNSPLQVCLFYLKQITLLTIHINRVVGIILQITTHDSFQACQGHYYFVGFRNLRQLKCQRCLPI